MTPAGVRLFRWNEITQQNADDFGRSKQKNCKIY